jgi:RNA polymerase sigma-70 factor (ECF subfamily)
VRKARTNSELALIHSLQRGDSDAVAELEAHYSGRIFHLAIRCLGNHEDAEELTQDVLLIVCRRIRTFRCDSALSSWIHRITFNAAMSRLRRTRLRRHHERGGFASWPPEGRGPDNRVPEPADAAPAVDEAVMREELRARLHAAILHVPDPFRRCLVLRDIQGLTTREASAVLRIKPQTLKSRVHRGRRILCRRLAGGRSGVLLGRSTLRMG